MKNNRGYMLAETLIVTTFVAGILVFLFIQFTNLSNNYEESYKYNTVEGIYALDDVKEYIISDDDAYNYIKTNVSKTSILDITDCSIFTSQNYCSKLFDLENIENIIISTNMVNPSLFNLSDENYMNFIRRLSSDGTLKYRIIARFNNDTYATIRFGD